MHSKTFSVVTCLLVNVIVAKPLFEGGFMMTDPSNLESMAKKQTIESDRSKSENLNLPEVKESDKTEEAFSQVPHNRPRISSEPKLEDNSKEASRELNSKDKLEDQPQNLTKRADVVDKDNLKPKGSPPKPKTTDAEPISSGSAVEKVVENISSTVPGKNEVPREDESLPSDSTDPNAFMSFRTRPDDASKAKSSTISTNPQDTPKENKNGWFNFFNLFQPKPASDASSKPKDSVSNDLRPITDKEAKSEDIEKFKETVNDKPRTVSKSVKENTSVNADKPKAPESANLPTISESDSLERSSDTEEFNDSEGDNTRVLSESIGNGAPSNADQPKELSRV